MTALQEKLVELAEYAIGFNMYDGNFLVNITYKDGWSIISPSDDSITFMRDDKRQNTYYYSAPLTTDMSKIFKIIDETIAYNKELEDKVKLFRKTIEEIQTVFTNRPITELRKMRFMLPSDEKEKPKRTKKANKTKKTEAQPPEETKPAQTENNAEPKKGAEEENRIDKAIEDAIKNKETETIDTGNGALNGIRNVSEYAIL